MQTPQANSTRTAAATPARWRDWLPATMAVDGRERLRVVLGALLGILATGLLAHALVPPGGQLPWLVAPIGASAVLVFGAPSSPFAHPWAVVGGNVLSTLAGVACVMALGAGPATAAVAVAAAIALMFTARCLHPPGGACALLVALGGVVQPEFAWPVLLDSLVLVTAAVAYNAATGRPYPARPAPPVAPLRRSFTDADLDAVLARYNQVLDVSREDLIELLEQAQVQAWRRRAGQLRCGELMSPAPLAVGPATPLHEAWSLLHERRVKALPVIDAARRIVGIVTRADFMREAGVAARAAQTVGEIMTRQVRVVSAERPIGELLPLFAGTGHHHVPVLNHEQQLVGIITQSDVVRALARLDLIGPTAHQ